MDKLSDFVDFNAKPEIGYPLNHSSLKLVDTVAFYDDDDNLSNIGVSEEDLIHESEILGIETVSFAIYLATLYVATYMQNDENN